MGDFIEDFRRTPVFREYLHFTKTADHITLKYLLTFLNFGKKLPYDDARLNATSLRGWLEREEELRNLTLPPWVTLLREILTAAFSEWDADVHLPVHGGGAVSEAGIRGTEEKNKNFTSTPSLDWLYGEKRAYQSYSDVGNSFPDHVKRTKETHLQPARLRFVPKDFRKTRSICMEPVALMWAQQAVRLWYERIFQDGLFSDHVFLEDQSVNQWAANYGCLTTLVDTIDLSAASDSVAWNLVQAIMPAKVLKHLYATRSTHVKLPTGETRRLAKFAPMGSALCFPVQTSIYASIVMLAGFMYRWGVNKDDIGQLSGQDIKSLYQRTFNSTFEKASTNELLNPFYIYGDDIVCDKRTTSNVMDLLTDLGFIVNTEKSYTGPVLFRESCGFFGFNGYDVTPLVNKTKPISNSNLTVDSLASFIDLANRAYDYKYLSLRKHLLTFLRLFPIQGIRAVNGENPLLYSNNRDDAMSLYTEEPRNPKLLIRVPSPTSVEGFQPTRYGEHGYRYGPCCAWPRQPGSAFVKEVVPRLKTCDLLQIPEVLRVTVVPARKSKLTDKFSANYRYMRWWRSRYATESTDVSVGGSTVEYLDTRLAVRWTPLPS